MERIKTINRTIRFDSRKATSKYRCKYGNRNDFDILRIYITLNDEIREVYEVGAKFLPLTDSIHFNARPSANGFEVFGWTAVVAPYIRKI